MPEKSHSQVSGCLPQKGSRFSLMRRRSRSRTVCPRPSVFSWSRRRLRSGLAMKRRRRN